MNSSVNLLDYTIEDLQELFQEMGLEKFRAKQVFQWVNKGIRNIDEMTNISKDLREKLKSKAYIGTMEIRGKLVSKIDGTMKYLFKLGDGNIIESVLMEYKHGFTACLTTQIGCRMGCCFCASAGVGLVRNLTSGEILEQIFAIERDSGKNIGNIVLMGIGEPFDNYDNVIRFLRTVNSKEGRNIGFRRITISTCGLVPEILRFSKENIPANLSISLHAPNDEIRGRIMPVNKRYSIDKIIEACKIYTEEGKRRITFEYAMMRGVNDSAENAKELASRLRGMLGHVNLIPVNSIDKAEFKRSDRKKVEEFKNVLERYGIETTIRRELGEDISAACGQLRRSVMEE